MKKLVSLLLAVCMCLSISVMLTACGHEHTYQTEWSKDTTHHWHACEGEDCTDVADKAEHLWNDGEITTPATKEADGAKTFACTACGQTKTENVDYVMDQATANRVYSYTNTRGIIGVEINREGIPLSLIMNYTESLLPETDDTLDFIYNDEGKMTAVIYGGVELAVNAYDEKDRPTATAENGESISFSYDDTAKTTTITLNTKNKSWTFDEYNRCTAYYDYRNYRVTFDGNVGKITSDDSERYYLVTYENNTILTRAEEFEPVGSGSSAWFYTFEYTEKGLFSQSVFAEIDNESRTVEDQGRSVYEYDADERVVKITTYDKGGTDDTEEKYSEETYEYNSEGKVVKETYIRCSSNERRIMEYEYDSNGVMTKETSTRYNGEGVILSAAIMEYNSDGGYTSINISYENGIETNRSERQFDKDGNLIVE